MMPECNAVSGSFAVRIRKIVAPTDPGATMQDREVSKHRISGYRLAVDPTPLPPRLTSTHMESKLRAWWSHRQGLDGSLHDKSPAEILERCGWARSVGG